MRQRYNNNVALPPHFVNALQKLFTILDRQHENCGEIPFELIASRWQTLQQQLPPSFLECLRRVTPPDGMLSFERFLAGFRLAMINKQQSGKLHRVRSEGKLDESTYKNPAMGVNGLLVEQHNFIKGGLKRHTGSQPSLNRPLNDNYSYAPLLRLPEPNGNYGYTRDYMDVIRRPASAGGQYVRSLDSQTNSTTSDSTNGENYGVVMRDKQKLQSLASSTKTIRAPPPPILAKTHVINGQRYRPASLTSSGSGSCSSGMAEVRWNGSNMSSNSPPERQQYAEELQPQVAKHEQLLEEEAEVVKKGVAVTKKLLKWYDEREQSLQKRRRMLNKGMVALDSAVHEQKLNFQRAQITELNRHMSSLMATTERGFPSHENMQIRNPVKPPMKIPTKISSTVSTPISSSEQPAVTAIHLLKQNQKLAEELDAKSRLIEQLQRDKRLNELKQIQMAGAEAKTKHVQNHAHRPAALVRPAMSNYSQAIKVHDTLL